VLLWEFSDPDLGFSTSGPAVVRIGDRNKNGNVLSSSHQARQDDRHRVHQFKGFSDQTLKLFVLNLYDGSKAINPYINTGIQMLLGLNGECHNRFLISMTRNCPGFIKMMPSISGMQSRERPS